MERIDLRLNDFEIKAIVKACPDYELTFSEVASGTIGKIKYTKIDIYDMDHEFCNILKSYMLNREFGRWEKRVASSLIEEINTLVPLAQTKVSMSDFYN